MHASFNESNTLHNGVILPPSLTPSLPLQTQWLSVPSPVLGRHHEAPEAIRAPWVGGINVLGRGQGFKDAQSTISDTKSVAISMGEPEQ